MDQKSNVIPLANAKSTDIATGTPVEKITKKRDNGGTGGGNMNDRYVTHEELNHAIQILNDKVDLSTEEIKHQIDLKHEQTNTKFANQRVWIILTMISVFASAAGIVSLLLNIFK